MLMKTTGVGQDIIDASVRAMFDSALEEQSSELYYQRFGLVDFEPDVPEDKINDMSGPGKGILTVEGQQYGSNEKIRGYPVTLELKKYTSELSWTEEEVHWINKANASSKRAMTFKSMPGKSVQALNQNINETTCKVFYLGFGTTLLNCGNSEALYGSHNIRKTGSSQKNTFATADGHLALSNNALIKAINIMNRFKAHNDTQLLRVRNLKLVVAYENLSEAIQIIKSLYGPENAQLGLQKASELMLKQRGIVIEVVVAPDIPYAYRNYWFLNDMNRAKERAYIAWGWKPRMSNLNDNRKGTIYNEASTLFGPLIHGFQWTFGSKGDASIS